MKALIISTIGGFRSFLGKKVMFLVLFFINIFTSIAQDAGPSVENIKKSAAALKEEQERLAHEQLIHDITYISIGFAIVVAIAWFATSLARKKSQKDAEERQRIITKIHGDPHKRAHLHKARR